MATSIIRPLERMEELMQCSICMGAFLDPRNLPCGHCFCLNCITTLCGEMPHENRFACPLCREMFFKPREGIDKLPKSFTMTELRDIKEKLVQEELVQLEHVQVLESAMQLLTDKNLELQQEKETLKQQLIRTQQELQEKAKNATSLEQQLTKSKQMIVHLHQGSQSFCKEISRIIHANYCPSQQVDSGIPSNGGAEVTSGDRLIESRKLKDLQQELLQELERFMEQQRNDKSQLLQVKEALETLEGELSRVQKELQEKEESFSATLEDLDEKLKQKIQDLNYAVDQIQILNKTRWKLSRDLSRCHRKIEENRRNKRNRTRLLAQFRMTQIKHEKCINQLQALLANVPTCAVRVAELDANGNRAPVYGVTILDNDIYVIRMSPSQIEVYSADSFEIRHYIQLAQKKDIVDITSCSKRRCIYLADAEDNRVHRLQVNGDSKYFDVIDKPYGLSVTPSDCNVLVTFKEVNKLKMFTSDGDPVRDIVLERGVIHPRHAIQLDSGLFVVCHGEKSDANHRLCLVTADGRRVVKSYTGNSTDGEGIGLGWPTHVAIDQWFGHILVTDCNNKRVVILNMNLVQVGEISHNSLSNIQNTCSSPWTMCFDSERNRLYVGELGDRVSVFTVHTVSSVISPEQ